MANFRGQGRGDDKISDSRRKEIFWTKVAKKSDGECWEWEHGKNQYGYGRFWNGENLVPAHRFAYESYHKGVAPRDLYVLHLCDNPGCCNPHHLVLGTQKDNIQDMVKKGRGCRSQEVAKKIAVSRAKFYSGEIWLIRKLVKSLIDQRFIAKMFKTSQNTVWRIGNSIKYICKEGYYT